MPPRDHEMMLLMVHAQRQDSEKAETTKLGQFRRVGRRHGQRGTFRTVFGPVGPPSPAIHRHRMGHYHAPDRGTHRPFPLYFVTHPFCDGDCPGLGIQRHIAHIDEMPAKRVYIDGRPIRVRVVNKNPDDFLNGGESRLPRFMRNGLAAIMNGVFFSGGMILLRMDGSGHHKNHCGKYVSDHPGLQPTFPDTGAIHSEATSPALTANISHSGSISARA